MVSNNSDTKVTETNKEVVHGPSVLGNEILVSGENIITESRPLIWPRFIPPIMVIIVGIAIYYLVTYLEPKYLPLDLEGLSWLDTAILWIGPAIAIIGLLSFIIRLVKWKYTVYALTNKRILRRTGVFGRSYLDCSLGKVQNVEVRISILSRIFKFGTIRVATARTKGEDIEWTDVRNPIGLQRQINEALEKYMKEATRPN